jgi:type VI secretion system protein ImpL
MKTTLLKFLKYALIVVAIFLIIVLVFGVTLLLNWPWWVGLFLLLILIGLGIGVLFLRKILLKRREEQFVQQVIEQDESHLKTMSGKEKDDLKELQNRWKEAIEALRKSHLRKYGNPLYVLPWYLVIGESGSGKTTAITSARLSSPFVEVSRTSGISGTRSCDWWFFEQAIILDTAGRYAIPIDEGRDKEEWQRFLSLLIRYRRREPIHGLIVSIAADKLLEGSPEVLEEDGRNIRRRIEELMRVLGTKFPIYVLVTKADLVQGMAQFCNQLPEKSLDQPMGFINQDLTPDVVKFQEKAFSAIGERLRNLRVLLLHQPGAKGIDPGLLLFPEEFEGLRRGLQSFMNGAFKENPYQETPILRGLFFTSGRQEGSPYSHFLKALGLIGEKEVLPGTSKGLFLHDLFSKILPKDRGLFAPTKRALQWRLLTRNLGLTAWIVLIVALCGILSFSFVKNLKVIQDARQEFKPPVLRGDVLTDLITMDRFCQSILKVEAQNQNWWIPRFGLNDSREVERGLKSKYCKQFQSGFLVTFDKQLSNTLATLSISTSDEAIAQYVTHLVRRINLLKARLGGESLQTLQGKPQPSYEPPQSMGDQKMDTEVKKKFGQLYLYYLIWRTDTGEINREAEILQAWLKDLLSLKRTNLRWLVVWADRQGSVPSINLSDFWGGSSPLPNERSVAPSLTRKGKELIDAFLKEIETALPDPVIITTQKIDFEKYYRPLCFDAWFNFVAFFPRGAERLKGIKEWQPVAVKVATEQGPHFAFLNKIAFDLEPLTRGEALPSWLQEVYHYQITKALSKTTKEGGTIDKITEEGKKLIAQLEKSLGREPQLSDAKLQAARAYNEYLKALTAIIPITASRNQAYQMAAQTYTEDPTSGKSPFFAASGALNKLRVNLLEGKPVEENCWRVISGPLDFLWMYARMETATYLQTQWEEKVLAEVRGLTGQQANQALLGPEGHISKFIKGPAGPFISRSPQRGFQARESSGGLGGSIPFDVSFLNYLEKATKGSVEMKQSYTITVKGFPTSCNPGAKAIPQSTKLELQCASGNTTLINYHYPKSNTFQWSYETCGDVIFQIDMGNLLLTKRYTGKEAFRNFLQDFPGGQKTFNPGDFPNEKASLEGSGIKFIKVEYQFGGEYNSLMSQGPLPGQAPVSIVKSW